MKRTTLWSLIFVSGFVTAYLAWIDLLLTFPLLGLPVQALRSAEWALLIPLLACLLLSGAIFVRLLSLRR